MNEQEKSTTASMLRQIAKSQAEMEGPCTSAQTLNNASVLSALIQQYEAFLKCIQIRQTL